MADIGVRLDRIPERRRIQMKEGIRYSSAERVGGRHKFFPQTIESLGDFVRQGYKWCRDEASFNQINYGKKQNSLMRGFFVAGTVNTH